MYLCKCVGILVDGSVYQRKVSKEELREAHRFPVGKQTHFDVSVFACCLPTQPGLLGMPYPPHLHLAALLGSALEGNSCFLLLCSHSQTMEPRWRKVPSPRCLGHPISSNFEWAARCSGPCSISLPTSSATSAAEGSSLSPISWEEAWCGHHFNFPPLQV